jgi:hypothetical protein
MTRTQQPIVDNNKCKMVISLRMPTNVTAKIKTCFENQANAWNEIYNMHTDADHTKGTVSSTLTFLELFTKKKKTTSTASIIN